MKRLFILVLAFIALFISKNTYADHVMGADIQWKCLGNDTFKIIFKFYRDCRGIPKSGSVSLAFSSDSCSSSLSGSLNCSRVSLVDITPVCSANKPCNPSNTMLSSIPYGIEEHTFTGKIYLGGNYANCCWYKFTFGECCRSGPINTGYSWANFSTELWLNRCITPCDNGPEFKNPPIAIKCAGQDVVYNHGVVDEDGDSLVYRKATPNGANYSSPWSLNYPLTCLGGNNPNPNATPPTGFYLDPQTGDMIFRPMQQQETVMKIKVEEWRKINGVYKLIGIATRDMQFIILANCSNKNPTISSLQPFEVCAGSQLCFTISTNDQDYADTTRIYWDHAIPAATFTQNNGTVKRAQGQFCWTPSEDDASTLPYYFRATVEDDHCPLNGRSTRAYTITVKRTPHADRYYTDLGCGKYRCVSVPKANYSNPTFEFKILNVKYFDDTVIYQFPAGGVYVVKHTITWNFCSDVYFDTIKVDTFLKAFAPKDTFVCKGQPILIQGLAKWGTLPYHYYWSSTDTNSSVVIFPTADTTLYFKITDNIGCISYDTVNVFAKNLPTITPNTDRRVCYGDSVIFDAGNANSGMTYNWFKNGSWVAPTQKITARDSGEYSVHMIDSFGCEAFDTVNLFVNNEVVIGPVQDVAICKSDTVTLHATGAQAYEWVDLSTNTVVSTNDFLTVTPLNTTTYIIKGSVTYSNVLCINFDTVTVTVKERPVISFPVFPKKCVDGVPLNLVCTVKYNNVIVTPTILSWYCPSKPAAIINSNQFDPIATAPSGGTFVVYASAEYNGCSITDSTTVTFNPLPFVTAGNDKMFCENFGPMLLDTVSQPFNVKFGVWSILSTTTPSGALSTVNNPPGYSYYFNTSSAGIGLHELLYRYKDLTTNCENTDTVIFEVIPIPDAKAGTLADVCYDHGLIALNAASGCSPSGGTWSGPGVSSGFFNPTINSSGTVQTYTLKYSVVAIGCSDEDSTTISVYPLPNVKLAAIAPVCVNTGNITLNGTPATGGVGTYSGNGVSGNVFNTQNAGVGVHKIKYHFKESTAPFCELADSITITVQDEPKISIDPIQPLCEQEIIQNGIAIKCNINSPFGVQWSADNPSGFNNPNASATIYHPSNLELSNHKISFKVISTQNGVCAGVQAILDADIYPTPKVQFTGDVLKGCKPLSVKFTSITDAGTGAVYSWDFGDPKSGLDNISNLSNPVHIYKDSGIYSVILKVTTINGCYQTLVQNNYIEVYPYPVASFNASPTSTTIALPKIKFNNTSTGNEPMDYHWDYGDGSTDKTSMRNTQHIYSVNDTGWYKVKLSVISREGCEDTISHNIYIGPDVTVFIPNVFSPDFSGPEKNDIFKVVAGGIKKFEIKIYDRWGETLYQSSNYSTHGWDGNYLSKPSPEDVYIYKVQVTSFDDREIEFDGTITLVR